LSNFDYDLIVIGAGSGGISSANLGKNLEKKSLWSKKKRSAAIVPGTAVCPAKH
jgi:pyruvate/2-oxoglutarate dehydrogenase complex dihydrolipoamide dehydrogenase (E3) component